MKIEDKKIVGQKLAAIAELNSFWLKNAKYTLLKKNEWSFLSNFIAVGNELVSPTSKNTKHFKFWLK